MTNRIRLSSQMKGNTFVIITVGAKTTIRRTLTNERQRVTGQPMHKLRTHQPTLTSMQILLPNSKKKLVALFISKHQSLCLTGGHQSWDEMLSSDRYDHLEPLNCAQSGSPRAKKQRNDHPQPQWRQDGRYRNKRRSRTLLHSPSFRN